MSAKIEPAFHGLPFWFGGGGRVDKMFFVHEAGKLRSGASGRNREAAFWQRHFVWG